MHIEILQSPWLCELMALHINLRESKINSRKAPALFEACNLTFNDDKPSLTCELFDSVKIDIDLTCSICLVSFHFSSWQGCDPPIYCVHRTCINHVNQTSIKHINTISGVWGYAMHNMSFFAGRIFSNIKHSLPKLKEKIGS